MSHFVIVGAGQAGIKAAETLRMKGHDGDILLVGEENWPPYQRPPLSKAYLKGELSEDRLFLKAADYYEKAKIALITGSRVAAIDPMGHNLTFADGRIHSWSRLLLATGTRARTLPLSGGDLDGVFSLRGIDDTKRIGVALETAQSVAIIGGGYIGMEFAAVARTLGKQVTVIEAQDRVLKRSVAPEISRFVRRLHEARGVRLALGEGVACITGSDRVEGVELASGETVSAELV